MFAFQQSGLVLLAEIGTQYQVICVPVHHKNSNWWQIQIQVEKDELQEIGILHNAQGKIRLFKQLNSAIEFLKETCKEIKEVTIQIT